MNLILCDKNCTHQKDGYCSLDTMTPLTASKADGCYYYSSIADAEKPQACRQEEGVHAGIQNA
ncbi:hypothetical protein [Candidatus Soleaferrea massiliensis]|uniref:hypothetical protein n=1 Tax=Candidatus Soleaferrea massiliensis TaxID=1470354 RepID=UPI0012E0A62C|nr:hypothetical protein [Candidatus Soleaferrea massiliensis]